MILQHMSPRWRKSLTVGSAYISSTKGDWWCTDAHNSLRTHQGTTSAQALSPSQDSGSSTKDGEVQVHSSIGLIHGLLPHHTWWRIPEALYNKTSLGKIQRWNSNKRNYKYAWKKFLKLFRYKFVPILPHEYGCFIYPKKNPKTSEFTP